MARLVKTRQPKLYDYVYQLRDKRKVQLELDMVTRKPVLHVSMMYPATDGCLALVMPICPHPTNSNGIIVYDLRVDPADWLSLSVPEIHDRVYTPGNKLPQGIRRIPLKTIHLAVN